MPRVTRGMGEALVGPSVIVHGTPEQRSYFLPRIISGEDGYCQGFSEPEHGSDLAAGQTRGVVEGDEVVITGQKVRTSGAARANRMFPLCRTYPGAEKHAGLCYVLIDFTGPGWQYRPARQMSGAAEFCQDFLDGVRAPLFGWRTGGGSGQPAGRPAPRPARPWPASARPAPVRRPVPGPRRWRGGRPGQQGGA